MLYNVRYIGIEIQDINVDMARRSVEYNGIGDCVDIVQGDIRVLNFQKGFLRCGDE